MCLGEGSGAVALFPFIDMGIAVYQSMSTFDDIHVEQYEELEMKMMILVTGGSGSGKSAFAEDQCVSFGEAERIYIATMFPFDEESQRTCAGVTEVCVKERDLRQWNVIQVLRTGTVSDRNSTVLLECMSNLVANEMFQEDGAMRK